MSERVLVVNADDFGRSPGVNRGIARAHEHGIVTSATLMVRWPSAREAAEYAQAHPALAVGLHLDLSEWEYRDETWTPVYEVVDVEDEDAVRAEVASQVRTFKQLLGKPPTHLDSHQHVHRQVVVRRALARAGRQLGVPVRFATPGITYSGAFYGQDTRGFPVPDAITVDALVDLIAKLPEGVTELGCHPGEGDDVDTTYATEREIEVATLCDPRVRAALDDHGVLLRSFAEVAP